MAQRFYYVWVGLLAFAPCWAAAAELLPNGDFELGNAGFGTDYTLSAGDILPTRTYDVVTDPSLSQPYAVSYGDHTSGSGLMMAVNGAEEADLVVWSCTIPVTPDTPYRFFLWVSSWYDWAPAQLDILVNGSSLGTVAAPAVAGIWQQFVLSWYSGASTSAAISLIDRNLAFSGNDFAIDDLSLSPISSDAVGDAPSEPGLPTLRGFPNPARGAARLLLSAPPAGPLRAGIYAVDGRRVRLLEAPEIGAEAVLTLSWDGRGETGELVPAGVYLARLEGSVPAATKLALVR